MKYLTEDPDENCERVLWASSHEFYVRCLFYCSENWNFHQNIANSHPPKIFFAVEIKSIFCTLLRIFVNTHFYYAHPRTSISMPLSPPTLFHCFMISQKFQFSLHVNTQKDILVGRNKRFCCMAHNNRILLKLYEKISEKRWFLS